MMFRSASRKARALSERVARNAASHQMRSKQLPSASGSRIMFSTMNSGENGSILSENEQFIHHPQPLPAVAYDYSYYDDSYDDEIGSNSIEETSSIISGGKDSLAQHAVNSNFFHDVTSRRLGTEILAATSAGAGTSGRGHTSTPYPPPSSVETSKSGPTRKASGGGGGRHRCPKCGTTVTFRCDFEENTFYCASCSGWFVANPNNTILGNNASKNKGDGSPYEEFLAKNGSEKVDEPEMLMRHVSFCEFFSPSPFLRPY
jgi:predicted RNA-binding Zn-ribbon protein involved in translation (DUF1610 family)